jgi:hypothetical protein
MVQWNTGPVVWGQVNGVTNVVQLSTAKPNIWAGNLYWWRNLLPNETLAAACQDWYSGTLNLAALCLNIISVQVFEWSPDGKQVIQNRGFVATTDEVDIFTQS